MKLNFWKKIKIARRNRWNVKKLAAPPRLHEFRYITRYPMASVSESNDCSWWFMYSNDSFIGSKL